MATKNILLVIADTQALADITQALGAEWMPTSVTSQADALTQLDKYLFDALLVDFNLGSSDASELLNQASERRPDTVRFLLAYEADLALVAAKAPGTHRILPKPIDFTSLKRRIDEGVAAEESSRLQSGGDPAAGSNAAPKVPAVYAEVLKALESPEATTEQVGAIIAQDAALTTEVLRLGNSAYLASTRLTEPVEAVGSLGLETVRVLIMTLRYLAENSHLQPGYLSIEKLWQHSSHVAQIARDLVLFETKDRELASQAFIAGLVHDLGKITFVTNFNDVYGRLHSLARKQPVAMWEAEKEMFGASHGEVGACLVGMWNLPFPVIEATADHHEPPLGENQQLTPRTALHIANVLEHDLGENDEFRVAPKIDMRVLSELGMLQRLPLWRAALAKGSLGEIEMEAKPVEPSQARASSPEISNAAFPSTANQLPGPVSPTRTATFSDSHEQQKSSARAGARQRRWIYASAAVALLLLLAFAFWITREPTPDDPVAVSARTSGAPAGSVASSPKRATESEVAPVTPTATASTDAPADNVPSTTLAASTPAPEPAIASSPNEAPTTGAPTATTASVPVNEPEPAPATGSSPKPEQRTPEFRLNGIFYTVRLPSAIINGQTVYVGSEVNGATVLKIGPNQVTLDINGEPKTYVLR